MEPYWGYSVKTHINHLPTALICSKLMSLPSRPSNSCGFDYRILRTNGKLIPFDNFSGGQYPTCCLTMSYLAVWRKGWPNHGWPHGSQVLKKPFVHAAPRFYLWSLFGLKDTSSSLLWDSFGVYFAFATGLVKVSYALADGEVNQPIARQTSNLESIQNHRENHPVPLYVSRNH